MALNGLISAEGRYESTHSLTHSLTQYHQQNSRPHNSTSGVIYQTVSLVTHQSIQTDRQTDRHRVSCYLQCTSLVVLSMYPRSQRQFSDEDLCCLSKQHWSFCTDHLCTVQSTEPALTTVTDETHTAATALRFPLTSLLSVITRELT